MGQLFGHTLRHFLDRNRDVGENHLYIVTESPTFPIPASAREIVAAGQMVRKALIATSSLPGRRVIILNPECFPVEARLRGAALASRSSLYWGEYADLPARAHSGAGMRCGSSEAPANSFPAGPK